MINNNLSSQNQLQATRDRITQLLTQKTQPQSKLEGAFDIGQALLTALSQNSGAGGFNQAYQGISQQRQQAQESQRQQELNSQMGIYQLMQDKAKEGDSNAITIDKAIRNVVGNDVNAYEKIASELHNFPEEVNGNNANMLVSKIASKINFKPSSLKEEELNRAYKQAQLDSLKYDLANIKPMELKAANLDMAYKQAQINKLKSDIQTNKIGNTTYNQNVNVDPILARQADKDVILKSRDQAIMANDSLRSLESIENSLFDAKGNPRVSTGKIQNIRESVGQYVPFVNSSNYQNVAAKSTKLSLDIASMLKGQTSDKDVERSLQAVPGYDKTPEANKRIIADQKAGLQVVAEMPKFISAWRNRYGSTIGTDEQGRTFDEAYLDWQSRRFKQLGGKKQPQSSSSDQQKAIEELKRRGKL